MSQTRAAAGAPPHLLQMMLSTRNGGAETFFVKLTLALADAGVRQTLVIEPCQSCAAALANHPAIDLRPIRFRGIHEPFGRLRLHRLLRRARPDLLLAWMNRAVKRAPTGYCPLIARLGGYYEVERYRKSDLLIANTPDIEGYLHRHGIAPARTLCIPNFGDIEPCPLSRAAARDQLRAELGIPARHLLLLALGRLHPAKAHDSLIHALARTRETSLLIAGDGPLRGALRALIERLGLNQRVHLLGWRQDTGRLFRACDLCVFPSRFEPFGNVVVESWAQRVPLIATAAAGPRWLISPDEDALLVPIDASDRLAAAIERLRHDPSLAARLVDNGYAKFQRLYSRDAITRRYRAAFDALLERSAARPDRSAAR